MIVQDFISDINYNEFKNNDSNKINHTEIQFFC